MACVDSAAPRFAASLNDKGPDPALQKRNILTGSREIAAVAGAPMGACGPAPGSWRE
jgi:hypothetical protein